ncbi:hypothetical protein [Streptococcus suis]|uniref:hypothetical protein n=1 Tax=Streptococcus suis TaxID=1307 RepID=UPI000CF3E4C8|nr:hypothetical protein [Streptococcus suis]
MQDNHTTVEISVEEYIQLRNKANDLQTENRYLRTIVDSVAVVMKNSGMVRQEDDGLDDC